MSTPQPAGISSELNSLGLNAASRVLANTVHLLEPEYHP